MLNDKQVRSAYSKAAKGGFKDTAKMADGQGLYLKGGRSWRYDYAFDGKRKTICFGVYPTVSLAEAREKLMEAKRCLAKGIDPMQQKKETKAQQRAEQEQQNNVLTFGAVTREWFAKKTLNLTDKYRKEKWQRIEKHILPRLGSIPMEQLTFKDMLSVLEPLHDKADLGKRIAQILGQICRYATVLQYSALGDVGRMLVESLPDRPPVQHRAKLTDTHEIGVLLNAIEDYSGYPVVRYALKIMAHVFLRSKELRLAKWANVDLEKGIWTIPAANMKKRREHVVPLSRQVKEMLQQLHDWTGHGEYLFASSLSKARVITDMTLLNALRHLGYSSEEMCIHGFRGLASTQLNELGFNSDLIETQLAHIDKNRVRSAYNAAQWLKQRSEMMQAWSNYLDKLKLEASTAA